MQAIIPPLDEITIKQKPYKIVLIE